MYILSPSVCDPERQSFTRKSFILSYNDVTFCRKFTHYVANVILFHFPKYINFISVLLIPRLRQKQTILSTETIITYLRTYLLYLLNYLLIYLLTYFLTYLLIYLLTYLFTYLFTYLLIYSMEQSPS